ncbi:MAG: hypothetical protein ACI3YH_07635, partial [Eubacteriales bacterium]
ISLNNFLFFLVHIILAHTAGKKRIFFAKYSTCHKRKSLTKSAEDDIINHLFSLEKCFPQK